MNVERQLLRDFRKNAAVGPVEQQFLIPKSFVGEVVKAHDDDENTRTFVISTGSVDRDQDTIAVNGWELGEFITSGVVLFGHDSWNPPIANPIATWVQGDKLMSRATFADEHTYDFGALILRLLDAKILKATSVGFIPLEWKVNEERPSRGWGPAIDFLKQLLLEWSVVPVPANPEALIQAGKDDGLNLGLMYDWAEKALDSGTKLIVPREAIEGMRKSLKANWGGRPDKGETVDVPEIEEVSADHARYQELSSQADLSAAEEMELAALEENIVELDFDDGTATDPEPPTPATASTPAAEPEAAPEPPAPATAAATPATPVPAAAAANAEPAAAGETPEASAPTGEASTVPAEPDYEAMAAAAETAEAQALEQVQRTIEAIVRRGRTFSKANDQRLARIKGYVDTAVGELDDGGGDGDAVMLELDQETIDQIPGMVRAAVSTAVRS